MHAAIGTGALLRMALKYMQVYLQQRRRGIGVPEGTLI